MHYVIIDVEGIFQYSFPIHAVKIYQHHRLFISEVNKIFFWLYWNILWQDDKCCAWFLHRLVLKCLMWNKAMVLYFFCTALLYLSFCFNTLLADKGFKDYSTLLTCRNRKTKYFSVYFLRHYFTSLIFILVIPREFIG